METIILYVVISEEPFTAGAWHYVALSNQQVTLLSKEHSAMFKAVKVIIATVDVQDRCTGSFATYLCRETQFCSSRFWFVIWSF